MKLNKILIILVLLSVFMGAGNTFAQGIKSEGSNNPGFFVYYPDSVPIGLKDIDLIVLKDVQGVEGANVLAHKSDENLEISGSTDETGFIRMSFPHPLESVGNLSIEVSYNGIKVFSTSSEVFNKLSGVSWYVNANTGSDTNSGKDPNNAFKTISFALTKATGIAGNPDNIYVASGLYDPYMTYGNGEKFPLNMKSYVNVYGENSSTTIIDTKLIQRPVRFQIVTDALLSGFTITGGKIGSCGGGVLIYASTGTLSNCIITDNFGSQGGGICCISASPLIHNNLIIGNRADFNGAGITVADSSSPVISNCTIANNQGPGIHVPDPLSSNPMILDSIIWDNSDDIVNVEFSEISYCDISDGDYNGFNNNFSSNPLFLCNYYLSHTSAGQGQNSPCINSGSTTAVNVGLDSLTTRIDGVNDTFIVDLGFHYQNPCINQCFIYIAPPTTVFLFLDPTCGSSTYTFTGISNQCYGTIVWTSSDTNVATVDPVTGLVIAVSIGTATIRGECSTDSSCFAEAYVNVADCCVIDIVSPKDVTLYTSILCGPNTHDFDATSYQCGGNVIWSSSDRNVARIHPVTGVVDAVAPGTCTITARCSSDSNCFDVATVTVIFCSSTCAVDIVDPEEYIVYLDPSCGPTTHDFDALSSDCNGVVQWSSSDTNVATIDPITGVVTSVGIGYTFIRANCASNPACFDEGIIVVSDCNRGEIDVDPTALYFQSGLDDNNMNDPYIAPQSGMTSQSNYYYYVEGEKVYLELSLEEMVLQFKEGIDEQAKNSILSSEKLIGSFDISDRLTKDGFILVQLMKGAIEDEVVELVDKLSRNASIKFAGPVFKFDNNRMIPTKEMIVKFSKEVSQVQRDAILKDVDISIIEGYAYDKDTFILNNNRSNGFDTLIMAEFLDSKPETEYAEPNFIRLLEELTVPDDTYYPSQWALENYAQLPWGTVDADIDASSAWDIATGGSNVTVAIVDEGVDQTHEDLVNNIVPGYDATDDPNETNPNPSDGHGTCCAGIAAGQGNNNMGVSGIGWNMKIMPIRIAYGYGGGWMTSNTWIANGINWAVDHGADVLSNSWGGGGSSNLINAAIQHAKFDGRGGKGCPILFSSGNNNGAIIYPSTRPEVISVGASSPCDERKQPGSCDGEGWGSCYGNALDVISPGVKIYTTDITGPGGYTSGNYFSTFNGTSSACPGAAGLCSLIISYNTNLTAPQTQWILENAADDMVGEPSEESPGWDMYHGHGRINANQSMIRVSTGQNDRFLTVTNLGTGALIVYKISSGNLNPWIEATPDVFLLNPTQSQVVTVTVDDYQANFGTNYDVLRIYSDDADENPFDVPVTFFNYDLLAEFTSDVTSGSSPLAVQFIDYSTGTIDTWNWAFGDGSSSTLPSPEHTYVNQGTYTVQLTVTGSGRTDTITKVDYILVDCGIALNADQITLSDAIACLDYQFDLNVIRETCAGVVAFASTNTNVATVDAISGVATGVAPGICQIRAFCSSDPSCFSIVDVTVNACPIVVPAPTIFPSSTPLPSATPTISETSTPTPTPTSPGNNEFLVNKKTDNAQTLPVIGTDGDGNFVIAWESTGHDGDNTGIFARRFSNQGIPLGDEFQVNTYIQNKQCQPAIAMNFMGKFVITWSSLAQDGSNYGVFAQRFNIDGTPAGREFQVNTFTNNNQFEPSVGMDISGNFVIAWSSKAQEKPSYSIYAKRYDSAGKPLGDEFRVNTYNSRDQRTSAVAMNNDGNFVIAWAGNRYTYRWDIYAKRYDKSGNPLSGEFRVNTFTDYYQKNPDITMDSSGKFVITWNSENADGSLLGIFAQRYNSKWKRTGTEFQVNTYTQDNQSRPSIASDPIGNFLITWRSNGQDGSNYGIYAQLYNMDGNKIGNEFKVNTYTRNNQSYSTVIMTSLDYYVITWASNEQASQGSSFDIYAKQYKDDSFQPAN